MKKWIFSLFAAAVLAGAAVTAQAAPGDAPVWLRVGPAVMTYDEEAEAMSPEGPLGQIDLAANTTYYVPLTLSDGSVKEADVADHYRIVGTVEEGEGYISSEITAVAKRIKSGGKQGKALFLQFSTDDRFQMEEVDYELGITIYEKKPDQYAVMGAEDRIWEAILSGTVGYGADNAGLYTMLDPEKPVVTFDEDLKEYELSFDDKAVFLVGGPQNRDLFLRLDDEIPAALEEKYPETDMTAVLFAGNNKTFRKSGILTIPAEMIEGKDGRRTAPYLYSYEDGKLGEVKGVSYDDVAEEFVIKTNILGNYIVSDTELATGVVQQPVQTPLDDDWIPEGVEPNPNTGDVVWPAWLAALLPCAVVLLPHKK
ncbi:hypothetical protein [Ligaoa zhengdingensis]|uniref:hypothetical protein n=1 Tax=Ligaoa zhengdingensis TaxID=2763658 RepID=UPI0031BA8609